MSWKPPTQQDRSRAAAETIASRRENRQRDPGEPGPHETVQGLRSLAAQGDKYASWRLRCLFTR